MSDLVSGPLSGPSTQFPHSSPDTIQRDVAGVREGVDNANKYSKVEANYRPAGSSKTRCGACKFYQGAGICSQVEGDISPDGVSDIFQPRGKSLRDLVK